MSAPSSNPNPNKGYLFPNEQKVRENQPDYRGKVTINGQEWLLSAWKRDKDGKEMLTISATDPATLSESQRADRSGQGGQAGGQNQQNAQRSAPAPRPPAPAPAPASTPAPAPAASKPLDDGFGDIFDNLG